MCRLAIRNLVARHRICELSVPYVIANYISKSPYFDPVEDLSTEARNRLNPKKPIF